VQIEKGREMNVQQIMRELKKHPPRALVGVQDHDQPENEINGLVKFVKAFDPENSKAPDDWKQVKVVIRL